jgi:hypothetical protein
VIIADPTLWVMAYILSHLSLHVFYFFNYSTNGSMTHVWTLDFGGKF